MRALRYFYASTLLRFSTREGVKALASYLGHSDHRSYCGVYTHLMPASEEGTRCAIDDLLREPEKS